MEEVADGPYILVRKLAYLTTGSILTLPGSIFQVGNESKWLTYELEKTLVNRSLDHLTSMYRSVRAFVDLRGERAERILCSCRHHHMNHSGPYFTVN